MDREESVNSAESGLQVGVETKKMNEAHSHESN